jgi:hypothetical protein
MGNFGKRMDGPGGRRVAPREQVLLSAAMLTLSSSRTVTLLDVSTTGARMKTSEELFLGQEVWLKINPSDIFGTVAWTEGDQCGILFDDPITEDTVAGIEGRGRVVMIAGLSQDEQFCAEDWQYGMLR